MSEFVELSEKIPLKEDTVKTNNTRINRIVVLVATVVCVGIVVGTTTKHDSGSSVDLPTSSCKTKRSERDNRPKRSSFADSNGDFSSTPYNIIEDRQDILYMIDKAKKRKFCSIWDVLNEKPYLINVIPENESYALLHHAASFNHFDVVKKLVDYPACDVRVKSVPKGDNLNDGDKIPADLTSNEKIKRFLKTFTVKEMESRFATHPVFFATQSKGENYNRHGLPLMLITLSEYKKTFDGKNTLGPSSHFQGMLKIAYQSTDLDWLKVETVVMDSLYGFNAGAATYLKSKSKMDFCSKIINLYTGNSVYRQLNQIMKTQAFYDYSNYRPRSEALHLGPYALMLDAVLTFWDKLVPYSQKTYRGVSSDVTSHYHVGMIFVYLEFVSSTDEIAVARRFAGLGGSVFVINNGLKSPWQPRNVAEFSQYQTEREYLYPPGAEFQVVAMDIYLSTYTYIYLDLKDPQYV